MTGSASNRWRREFGFTDGKIIVRDKLVWLSRQTARHRVLAGWAAVAEPAHRQVHALAVSSAALSVGSRHWRSTLP